MAARIASFSRLTLGGFVVLLMGLGLVLASLVVLVSGSSMIWVATIADHPAPSIAEAERIISYTNSLSIMGTIAGVVVMILGGLAAGVGFGVGRRSTPAAQTESEALDASHQQPGTLASLDPSSAQAVDASRVSKTSQTAEGSPQATSPRSVSASDSGRAGPAQKQGAKPRQPETNQRR